jgi:hypothetical protein
MRIMRTLAPYQRKRELEIRQEAGSHKKGSEATQIKKHKFFFQGAEMILNKCCLEAVEAMKRSDNTYAPVKCQCTGCGNILKLEVDVITHRINWVVDGGFSYPVRT